VVATIPVGIDPEEVAVNPATNTIYVTNMDSGTVSVIRGQTKKVVATIPVGTSSFPEPRGVAVNPATDTIYVANQNDGTVSVISGRTNTVVATIPVGAPGTAEPVGVADNPRNQHHLCS
jgi:YVTN family beta-propeller protein